jgi:hypothetical protein
MADIGALALKITADAAELNKALADAEARTRTFGERTAAGLKGFAGGVDRAFGAIRTGADLMRGRFETAGQSLGMLGSIAGAIPGPWGAAAGAILTTGGQVVDFLQRDLLRAQRIAREGFMHMATGARTAEQALGDIRLGVMSQALERMAQQQQRIQQMNAQAAAVEGRVGSSFGAWFGGVRPRQGAADPVADIAEQVLAAESQFRQLMRNPQLTEMRSRMAGEQARDVLTDLARSPQLAQAHRTINRSLRGGALRRGRGVVRARGHRGGALHQPEPDAHGSADGRNPGAGGPDHAGPPAAVCRHAGPAAHGGAADAPGALQR